MFQENESLRKELEESQASLDALAKLPDAES